MASISKSPIMSLAKMKRDSFYMEMSKKLSFFGSEISCLESLMVLLKFHTGF